MADIARSIHRLLNSALDHMPTRQRHLFPEFYAQLGADVYIVSFPKSGRTWLRVMLGKYLAESTGLEFEDLTDVYANTRSLGKFPTIAFVHDDSAEGAAWGHRTVAWDELERKKSRYRRARVILLVRDPRDTVVSYFFHCTRRRPIFDGDISDFIRDDYYGARKVVEFLNIWLANRHKPVDFLKVHYEALHVDPAAELSTILEFVGVAPSSTAVERTIEFSRFENMKKMERANQFNSSRLGAVEAADPESFKVRKGEIGGYKASLPDHDVDYLDDLIATHLASEFGY